MNPIEQLSAQFDSYNTIKTLAAELVDRDPVKYSVHKHPLALIAAFGGLPYWEGYYFHRYIDDILDSDIKHQDPVVRVNFLRQEILSGFEPKDDRINDPILRLGERYLTFAQEHNPFPDRDPRQECLRSIDGMLYDYYRGEHRVPLTKERLDAYYDMTFDSVLTIAEMLIRAPVEPSVKQLLIYGQGEIYSLRDLDEDWDAGILNIPTEVLDLAGLNNASTIDEVRRNTTIQQWVLETIDNFTAALNSDEVQHGLRSMQSHSISAKRQLLVCNQLLENLKKTAQKQKIVWSG